MSSIHPSVVDLVKARVGTRIKGKWHVDALLGVGGMGAVYSATHRNGNRVALKVLHTQLSIDGDIRARFGREGYVANAVQHPGVVRVLDDDETEDGAAFLVMELLQGETAEARAARFGGRLPLDDVLALADGLLDVLAAAHASGIVHRDIKPENVFFTRERAIKVLDFGIARLREAGGPPAGGPGAVPGIASNTRTGITMGTPAFMPPEQAMGRIQEVDALSDIWAVGATIFALVSGRPVHEAQTPMEAIILAATAQARSLATAAAGVPTLVPIVDRALAFAKTSRWPSARAMQNALRESFPIAEPEVARGQRTYPPASAANLPVAGPASRVGSSPPSSGGAHHPSTILPWVEERKLATVVFADIVGFSALANDLEPEAVREFANTFFEPLSRELEREGGTVVKYIGDSVMAAFGVPVGREDDAERAVRAALAMTSRVREIARRHDHAISLRVGICTGVVMVGTVGGGARAAPDIMGSAVHLASCIEDTIEPNEIVIAQATERLVRHRFDIVALGEQRLRGIAEPVHLFRVVAEKSEDVVSSRLRSPSTAPFFARRKELAALVATYESVASERGLRVVELSGDVGVGKSHLLRQLSSALGARPERPEILRATRGSALLPLGFLGRLLRARFHVRADEEPDVVRARVVEGVAGAWTKQGLVRAETEDGREAGKALAELVAPLPAGPLLGTEIAGDRTRTAAAFADWVKQLAAERPVVLVLEHVEWHDEPSLDLLQFLLRALRRVPVLLILSARRGPSEQIPTWLTGCDVRTKIELHPFTLDEMERFLDDLFKRIPNFPRELRSEILHRSEGNPALCRELVRLLVDRGALVVDDEHVPVRWEKGRSSKLVLPDTVLGVLQARLDGLPFAEKELLKLAAVIGRVFWLGALETLVPHIAATEVMALVDALSAREFLIPAPIDPAASGGREYSFSTQALRDTAYELVPGNSRKAAHRRVAEWLVARGELWEGGQADLAVHLDAAGEHERARRHHLSAARQALGVHAYPDAVACFERMARSWPAETTKDDRIHRAGVLRERAAAEAKIGRFDEALRSLDTAANDLALAGVPREDAVHGWIALERGLVLKEYGRIDASLAALDEGVELASSQPPGLLHMRFYSARAFQRAAKGDRAGAAADTAAGLRIGQSLNVRDASWHLAMARLEDAEGAVYFFEEKFDAAEAAFQRSLEHRDLGGDPQGMQDAYVNLGGLAFSRRDWAAAATYYEKALASARKLRWASREAIGHSNLGQAKLAAGDAESAVRELEVACRLADEGDYLDVLADSVRALSEAQLASGAVEAALATARLGIDHAEKSGTPYFIAMANAAAMDAHLAKMNLSREKEDFAAALRHRDAAVGILRDAKQTSAADQVEKRFQKGSNSTVNT